MAGIYLIAFEQTHAALQAEELLIEAGINVGIAPLPADIKAGCGFCVSLPAERRENAEAVLKKNGLAYSGIYERI